MLTKSCPFQIRLSKTLLLYLSRFLNQNTLNLKVNMEDYKIILINHSKSTYFIKHTLFDLKILKLLALMIMTALL